MKKEYESLFTPWKIGNCEIKNRFVQTSMGGTSIFGWMELHHFDKEAANFLLERAQNNVGLILPGIAPIRNVIGGSWLYKSKKSFRDLKKFMVEYHKTGAKLFIQLTAGFGRAFAISHLMELLGSNKLLGTLAKPAVNIDKLTISASENPNRWSDKVPSREMTIKEIEEMIYAFGQTAKMCMEAGVDGVEIHAVHEGYLLDQFATKYTNRRTDKYGGSLENRYRFPAEIVKEIKKVCGKDYPVSLRYSVQSKVKDFREGILPGEDYKEIGRDLEESLVAAKFLEDAGYDMFNADNGTYDSWYWAHPPMYMPMNCNLEDCKAIKEVLSVPVVCAGKMDPVAGAEAITAGSIDGVGFARQFLADPQWITKLMEDREADILPCINCHNACFTMASYKGVANDQPLSDTNGMSRCALNPQTMQSKKYYIKPTKTAKKIAVIGGGVGGMEVARVATLRGHKVSLFEKSNELGGVFIAAAAPSFKEKDRELIAYLIKQITDLGVDIKLNTPVDV
ncbi:MAG: FAD-dependent oxidoreductase, partial [Bacillota bacterium]